MTSPHAKAVSDRMRESSDCVSIQELNDYSAGWSDDNQSERIETHLAECSACQNALQKLEFNPDTLMQSLQSTANAGARPNVNHAPISDEPIDAALEKARGLMDACPEPLIDKVEWQPTNREFGVYELLKPLGRGGMGAVYLASHKQLKKHVAIKLLPVLSADNADVRARFQREIRVVGRLNHPAIVTATDAGEIDGTQFLVMEYVPGMDLGRLARLLGKLPVAEACELIRQVALGLSCAHAEGVVHRDVKPSNLMLDEAGRVKILDFGLAQLSIWDEASVDLTTVGQLMGTLDYMAPEQAEFGGAVDYRADLYALGATLFRLLCGRAPLAAAPNQSPLEKLRLLANHQPPKLDTLCPDAPPELVTLVGSMLARSPQDRPASAAHVAEQLAALTESANLVALLKQAQEKEAQAPEPTASERNRRDFRPAMAQTDDAHMREGERRRTEGLTPPRSPEMTAGYGRWRIRRWILATAGLPLMIVAGILIKLELEKGQLVIESDVDNIKVQIISDGKPVSGLSINHGTTATRLRADKYEVIIDGPSDGLTIENGSFTLKNGETAVARIRFDTPTPILSAPIAGNTIPSMTNAQSGAEPLYEGKTLTEWLDLLGRERSITGLKSAFDACSALVSPETAERITSTILKVVPGLDGELRLTEDREIHQATVDDRAMRVLWKANPGAAFYKLWVREFNAGGKYWRERLWKYARYYQRDAETMEPFVAWAEARLEPGLFGIRRRDEDSLPVADYLRDLTSGQRDTFNEEFINRIFKALKRSPHLDNAWWLSQPLVIRSEDPRTRTTIESNLWPTPIKTEITRVALETLNDHSASMSLVAQACMILAHGAELSPAQQSRVLANVNQRLLTASAKSDSLAEIVPTNVPFAPFSLPSLNVSGLLPLRLTLFSNDSKSSPVLVFLDVIRSLNGAASAKEGLNAVALALEPTSQMLTAQVRQASAIQPSRRGSGGFSGVAQLLSWPEFQPTDSGLSNFAGYVWGGDKEPTPRDWLMFCILQHPVMQDHLKANSENVADTSSAMNETLAADMLSQKTSTPKIAEPVYDSKTLDQWLHVIETERSPEVFIGALNACAALTTPATSEQITKTLLKVLPTWNGDAKITIDATTRTETSIDEVAFYLLAKANPGRKYYELLVAQYQNPDANWRTRLAKHVWHGDYEQFSSVEPLIVWAENTVRDSNTKPFAPQDLDDATSYLIAFLGKFPDNKTFTDSSVAALRDCKALGPNWWLARPVASAELQERIYETWPAALHAEVIVRAINAFEDPASSEQMVAQAAMILATAPDLTAEQKSQILTEMNPRLEAAAGSPEKLGQMVEVDAAFSPLTVPSSGNDSARPAQPIAAGGPGFRRILWYVENWGKPRASLTQELLDLFQSLKSELTPQTGIAAIATALKDVKLPDFQTQTYTVKWPELQVTATQSIGRRGGGTPSSFVHFNQLTPPEILKVVLHEHPVLVAYRDSLKTDETPENPATPQP